MADLLERAAARVLLLDGRDRLLLFHGGDPARPENGSWWITPGGGLEVGEDAETAALRELREETGLFGVVLEGPVWQRVAEFEFDGLGYRQSEVFFLARVETHDVDTSGFDDLEQRAVVGHRWWSIDEIDASQDVIYPRRLAVELRRLLEDGLPESPYEVGE
jgi:8-oxo-dGTP pyrophosphatase MutT (NUDIX family)